MNGADCVSSSSSISVSTLFLMGRRSISKTVESTGSLEDVHGSSMLLCLAWLKSFLYVSRVFLTSRCTCITDAVYVAVCICVSFE